MTSQIDPTTIPGETPEFRRVRREVSARELARPDGSRALTRMAGLVALLVPTTVVALLVGGPWAWIAHLVVATVVLCTIPAVYHEGTHGNLARTRPLNELAATVAAALHFVPFETWRLFHLSHHANAGTDALASTAKPTGSAIGPTLHRLSILSGRLICSCGPVETPPA